MHGNTAGSLAEKYEKFALKWADLITVSSKEMLDYYQEKGYDVEFTPNALDLENLPKGENRKYEKQIIYAARLSEEKGILDVLEISKKLPNDMNLIILGDGPEKDKVEKIALSNSNIHYLGLKTKGEVISLIRGSDLLIQPSIMEGGTSYTLLESMACGTPIICTNVGGGKDMLHHMQNSYIIKPKNPSVLVTAIKHLMSNSILREELKINALAEIKNYDWSIIGKKYTQLYENLLLKK